MMAWKRARALATVFMVLLTLFLGWYGGLDYSERGFIQAFAVFMAGMIGIIMWTFPWKILYQDRKS